MILHGNVLSPVYVEITLPEVSEPPMAEEQVTAQTPLLIVVTVVAVIIAMVIVILKFLRRRS